MRYAVAAPGFVTNPVEIETAGFLSGAKLLQNGKPATKGAKRGTFLLRRDDGGEATARLRIQAFFVDPVPAVEIDGQRLNVVAPFRWYEIIWLGLPVLLILVGGAIGAIIGFIAAGLNASLFRSDRSTAARYALTGGMSLATFVVWVIIATLFLAAVGQ